MRTDLLDSNYLHKDGVLRVRFSFLRAERSEDLHFFIVALDMGYAQFKLFWNKLALKLPDLDVV